MTLAELHEYQAKADALRAQLLELTMNQSGRTKKGREVAMGMLHSRQLIADLTTALWKQANEVSLLRLAYVAALSEEPPVIH